MQFIIKTKDASHAYKSWQEKWPDKLHNINSRSFKKIFNQTEYRKLQLNWVINKYLGKASSNDLLFSYQNVSRCKDDDAGLIPVASILEYLAKVATIDNDYVPEKGDELTIYLDYYYKEIKGVKRPEIDFHTISLIYKETQWRKGSYDFNYDETQFYLRGVIEL